MAKFKRLKDGKTKNLPPDDSFEEDDSLSAYTDKRDEVAKAAAKSRPPSEREFARRFDRLKPFIAERMDDFVFDEFSEAYLKKAGMTDMLGNVPIPLRPEDIEGFKSSKGLAVTVIGENMARVFGIDPRFKYKDVYVEFLKKIMGKSTAEYLVKEGKREAATGSFDDALIHFRAALVIEPENMAAMYGYARICRELYNRSTEAEYIGNFKAESFDYFELLTEIHPGYAQGWYYLGYMYLNMGLYTKASLTWESFLKRSRIAKDKREITQRLKQIEQPMEIERGVNNVMSGRMREGLVILERYKASAYSDWWPLWYYLGEAYLGLGRSKDAEECFIKTLRLNASHIESMEELVAIYSFEGKTDQVNKYSEKIRLISKQLNLQNGD